MCRNASTISAVSRCASASAVSKRKILPLSEGWRDNAAYDTYATALVRAFGSPGTLRPLPPDLPTNLAHLHANDMKHRRDQLHSSAAGKGVETLLDRLLLREIGR